MPARTNGVYQNHNASRSNCGAGAGVALKKGSPGMGKQQYGGAPVTKHSHQAPRGHENRSNSTYK